jgi:hypothetical protein
VRRLEDDRRLVGEHDRLVQRLVKLGGGQPNEVAVAFFERAQDEVAPLNGRRQWLAVERLCRDDETTRGVALGPLEKVISVGRLGHAREERGLRGRQQLEVVDPEIDLGRGGDPVRVVAVIDLVEIRGQDALLALVAGEGCGEILRLQDLLDLAHELIAFEHISRQQPRTNELLGDRRRATVADAGQVLDDGQRNCVGVVALVIPERAVLDGDRRVEQHLGNRVELNDAPPLHLETGKLDGAGAVVDDGRLSVVELLEARHVGQLALHPVEEREGGEAPGNGHDDAREQQTEDNQKRRSDPRAQTTALFRPRTHAGESETSDVGAALLMAVGRPRARGLSSIHRG